MPEFDPGILEMLEGQDRARGYLAEEAKDPRGGYLFVGPDGVGKRTAGILFAAAVNPPSFTQSIFSLSHPDISPLFPFRSEPKTGKKAWLEEWSKERDKYVHSTVSPDPHPSWVITINQIRELRKEMKYAPRVLRRRVGLLFDFDRIRAEGANAFLKTLEEPQPRSILVLTTSRPLMVPATVRSRCKQVRFNLLEDSVISEKLIDEGYEKNQVDVAVDAAFGSMKKAYTYLHEPASLVSEEVLSFLENPGSSTLKIIDLVDRLSYRTGLDQVLFTFWLVFRWILAGRQGKRPRDSRLARITSGLASMTSASLAHNIMLTDWMSARVLLNPIPQLFLYRYITSLSFR